MPAVDSLFRYPVKGLSAEALDRVAIAPGEPLPFDRAWAIENGPSGFAPDAPRHFPKIAFLMLMRNERLAELTTRFDEESRVLTIAHDGATVAEGALDTAEGRRTLEAFFDDWCAADLRGPARIVTTPQHTFSDSAAKVISLINLASVRAIESEIGKPVHPLRFRGNVYVDGLPAWQEFDWVGREIAIGGVRFRVIARIERCAATNVDPQTGRRDLQIPRSLLAAFDHADCGVYLEAASAGAIARGDTIVTG